VNEQKKMDAILEAIPWRCFHCDFITTDRAEAESHFGDMDDASEFVPICKWYSRENDNERIESLQQLIMELNSERKDNEKLREHNETLEYQIDMQESVIRSYKPFKDCRSINDVFHLYDSMEGRALAAEEREKVKN